MVLNKRTIESLIKAGGFDSLGHPRKGLCLVFEQIIDRTLANRRERDVGVLSLFGDPGDGSGEGSFDDVRRHIPIPDVEFDKSQRLAFEKEMLGLYVSDHPLKGVEGQLRRYSDCSIDELRELGEGEMRTVGGVVTSLVRKYTKKGELMATFCLEDLQASIDAWMFPRTHQEYGSLLADDAVVCVKGRIDAREEPHKLVVMEIKPVELSATEALHLEVDPNTLDEKRIGQLRAVLNEHPGSAEVFLSFGTKRLRLDVHVDTSNGLLAELRTVLPKAVIKA